MSCVKNRVEHDFLRMTGHWGSAMEVHLSLTSIALRGAFCHDGPVSAGFLPQKFAKQ